MSPIVSSSISVMQAFYPDRIKQTSKTKKVKNKDKFKKNDKTKINMLKNIF